MQGREREIDTLSEDPSPTLPAYRGKEDKGKIVEDKKGENEVREVRITVRYVPETSLNSIATEQRHPNSIATEQRHPNSIATEQRHSNSIITEQKHPNCSVTEQRHPNCSVIEKRHSNCSELSKCITPS